MPLFVVVLCALFVSYPSTGISDDTVRLSVSRSAISNIVLALTAADTLQVLKKSAGTIWHRVRYNSLDNPDKYWVILTNRDGQSQSFLFTPTEWSDHGDTSKGFFEILGNMFTEEAESLNGAS
jgi:hypothetical protein